MIFYDTNSNWAKSAYHKLALILDEKDPQQRHPDEVIYLLLQEIRMMQHRLDALENKE